MNRDTIIPALMPNPTLATGLLSHFAATIEADLTALEREFATSPVRDAIIRSRDEFAGLGARVRERVTGEGAEQVADLAEEFVRAVRGRDRFERLLSVHLGAGFVRDAMSQLLDWQEDVGARSGEELAELRDLLAWDTAQAPLVDALKQLFDEDITLDDRLAMWGRRIAGDAAVWCRQLLGVAPGSSPDAVVEGAEGLVDEFQAELMSEHSRRMNALSLAA